jgi:hypothetical protein
MKIIDKKKLTESVAYVTDMQPTTTDRILYFPFKKLLRKADLVNQILNSSVVEVFFRGPIHIIDDYVKAKNINIFASTITFKINSVSYDMYLDDGFVSIYKEGYKFYISFLDKKTKVMIDFNCKVVDEDYEALFL